MSRFAANEALDDVLLIVAEIAAFVSWAHVLVSLL